MKLVNFDKQVDVAMVCVYNQSHNFQYFFMCFKDECIYIYMSLFRCASVHEKDCSLTVHTWEKIGWVVAAEKSHLSTL